jgi:hypothetical protein
MKEILLALVAAFLAWRGYATYELLRDAPSKRVVLLFHQFFSPIGLVLPRIGTWPSRFIINLGVQGWPAAYNEARLGPKRINSKLDTITFVSIFPPLSIVDVWDASANEDNEGVCPLTARECRSFCGTL